MSAGSFGARPLRKIRERYLKRGVEALPKSWRNRWIIARIVATPPWFNSAATRAVYRRAEKLTKETGVKHVVDHCIPLQNPLVCGLHWHENLQVLTDAANSAKSNKFSIDQMELEF